MKLHDVMPSHLLAEMISNQFQTDELLEVLDKLCNLEMHPLLRFLIKLTACSGAEGCSFDLVTEQEKIAKCTARVVEERARIYMLEIENVVTKEKDSVCIKVFDYGDKTVVLPCKKSDVEETSWG